MKNSNKRTNKSLGSWFPRRLDTLAAVAAAVSMVSLSGCWLGAGAVGAEAGYVASQEDRSVGETVDDQVILASIKTKMLSDPDVSGLAINIDVSKGVVQLRGYVKTSAEIARAIEIAKHTDGVRRVESRLVLDPNQ